MFDQIRRRWNKWLGDRGERAAEHFLRKRGIRVIVRKYETSRGEIDLVARERDTLVFVEVKTRRRGEPAEAVTPEKQRRLTRAALAFLKQHALLDQGVPCRFDVIAIVWPDADAEGKPEIEHIRSAFEATGVPSMHS